MVQRKVPNKVDIQSDHTKTQKLLVNESAKKTKKTKMKKSGLMSPRSRMPPPPPPLALTQPNYMKSTTSSDAKKFSLASCKNRATETLARTTSLKMTKTPSFKPARTSMKKRSPSAAVLCENLDLKRATCSTTLKDCKFPAGIRLSPGGTGSEGTSVVKVCPYNYCSINGHFRVPFPPLKHFLLAKRCALKTQRSVKMFCPSPRLPIGDDPSFDEEHIEKEHAAGNHDEEVMEMVQDGPVRYEIDCHENLEQTRYQNPTEIAEEVSLPSLAQEVDSESSDMTWEIDQKTPLYLDDKMEEKQDIIHGDFVIKLENKLDNIPNDEVSHKSYDEVSFKSDDTLSMSDDCDSVGSYEVSLSNTKTSVPVLIPEELEADPDDENDFTKDQTEDHLSNEFQTDNIRNQDDLVKECNQAENSETEQATDLANESHSEFSKLNSDRSTRPTRAEVKRKVLNKTGRFNPRGPNFLPAEPELTEADKIELRQWELDERKNAEEWMVDYALRQAVTRITQSKNGKVSVLVEAFEKVMPAMRVQIQRNGSVYHHARPIQACS